MDLKWLWKLGMQLSWLRKQLTIDSRKKHLQLAYGYLVQVDVDEWFKRTRPTVILAVERDVTELTSTLASGLRQPRTARHRTL